MGNLSAALLCDWPPASIVKLELDLDFRVVDGRLARPHIRWFQTQANAEPKRGYMPEAGLPPHVEETVRAVESLYVQHREHASLADRFLDHVKATISRPAFLGFLLVVVVGWIATNVMLPSSTRPDPFPFVYLTLALSFGALCLTVLILATQWRADKLADHRDKLILQLAFVSEQKTAKLIALVEELRRDSPQVRDRVDTEAQQMTATVNVSAVSEALRDEEDHASTTPNPR